MIDSDFILGYFAKENPQSEYRKFVEKNHKDEELLDMGDLLLDDDWLPTPGVEVGGRSIKGTKWNRR